MEFTPTTTVQQILTNYPALFDVFLSHGMCESCQQSPPPVPLSVFAQKHCNGNLEGLIQELYDACQ